MEEFLERRDSESKQIVVFSLENEEFGVPIECIKEIRKLSDLTITKVPRSKKYIAGVVNLRGRILPVIDLRVRFRMKESITDASRIIVFEVEEDVCGAIVDAVTEVVKVPVDDIEPPAGAVSGIQRDYIEGIAKIGERLVVLVSLELIAKTQD
ncbi:MAG: chemotaxis protein CheW [Bacillota bacterium]|nr:chemotaxis protein CheW [Bacillota bacterium]